MTRRLIALVISLTLICWGCGEEQDWEQPRLCHSYLDCNGGFTYTICLSGKCTSLLDAPEGVLEMALRLPGVLIGQIRGISLYVYHLTKPDGRPLQCPTAIAASDSADPSFNVVRTAEKVLTGGGDIYPVFLTVPTGTSHLLLVLGYDNDKREGDPIARTCHEGVDIIEDETTQLELWLEPVSPD